MLFISFMEENISQSSGFSEVAYNIINFNCAVFNSMKLPFIKQLSILSQIAIINFEKIDFIDDNFCFAIDSSYSTATFDDPSSSFKRAISAQASKTYFIKIQDPYLHVSS